MWVAISFLSNICTTGYNKFKFLPWKDDCLKYIYCCCQYDVSPYQKETKHTVKLVPKNCQSAYQKLYLTTYSIYSANEPEVFWPVQWDKHHYSWHEWALDTIISSSLVELILIWGSFLIACMHHYSEDLSNGALAGLETRLFRLQHFCGNVCLMLST